MKPALLLAVAALSASAGGLFAEGPAKKERPVRERPPGASEDNSALFGVHAEGGRDAPAKESKAAAKPTGSRFNPQDFPAHSPAAVPAKASKKDPGKPEGLPPGKNPDKPVSRSVPSDAHRYVSPREREANVRVQAFLDAALFCPGKIDGLGGEFTEKAILRYQRANGLDETGSPHNLPVDKEQPAFTEYTLRAEDKKFVGSVPSRPEEQSHLRYLPYGSLLEFVTERFHCSEGLLAHLNPGINLETLKVGDTLKVPAVDPFCIENVRSTAALPERPELKARRIQISRKERILEVLEGDQLISSVPITPGSSSLPTPPGKWRLLAISLMPSFRWDEGVLNRGVRTERFFMLPPGPNNPVGVAWCALNKAGIGIHGTNTPETIGRAHSHGCMRVANWDVVRLLDKITAGIPVLIE